MRAGFSAISALLATASALISLALSATARGEAPDATAMPSSAADESFHPGIRIGARLHGGLQVFDQLPHHGFWLKRGRLIVDLEPTDWLRAQLDVDVASLAVKDAFARVAVERRLRIELGRFKKPFSRIELTGPRRLPLWRRGIANSVIVEDFAFGERDVGVMMDGRWGMFGYALGVFNGNDALKELDSGKDVAARLTVRPTDVLRLGASGSFKYVNRGCITLENGDTVRDTRRRDFWAAGVDARLKWDPVDWVVEGLWGTKRGGLRALSGTTYATVRIPITGGVELRPIVKLDLVNLRAAGDDSLAWSALVGVNAHIGDYVRLMIQAEGVWTQDSFDPSLVHEERLLVAMLAFDYRQWFRE